MFYKPEVRNKIRNIRTALTDVIVQKDSTAVATQVLLLKEFHQAKHIAYYLSTENEIDPAPIIKADHSNKQFYLPIMIASHQHLQFHCYQDGDKLITNRYGIQEPVADIERMMPPESLDCVLMPLVGFDLQCNRLGRGAGYYDKSFAFRLNKNNSKPLLIGLAYEFQKIQDFNSNNWDVPLDIIVTEAQTYYRNPLT
ncbi:MAG: 5-formyltetrahydrofolate cyclo-ligase [Gammaproteobacteria bacterium]|nr:5-formyltetrahydrofolate cyclo-ligase [Gammaproteobacteria bacterium]